MCLGLKVLTHLKPPRRFSMLFFHVLPFTTLASSVNRKTSKKSVKKNDAAVFDASRPLKAKFQCHPARCLLPVEIM